MEEKRRRRERARGAGFVFAGFGEHGRFLWCCGDKLIDCGSESCRASFLCGEQLLLGRERLGCFFVRLAWPACL